MILSFKLHAQFFTAWHDYRISKHIISKPTGDLEPLLVSIHSMRRKITLG